MSQASSQRDTEQVTYPFLRFAAECSDCLDLLFFAQDMSIELQTIDLGVSRSQLPNLPDNSEASDIEKWLTKIERNQSRLDGHRHRLLVMLFCRIVEQFEQYVCQTLALVHLAKPETLFASGDAQIPMRVLRESNDTQSVIVWLAERRAYGLASDGIDRLQQKIRERYGLTLFESDSDRDRATLFFEYRNLFVHRGGIVDDRLEVKLKAGHHRRGEAIRLNGDTLIDAQFLLRLTAALFDRQAVKKFKLPPASPHDIKQILESGDYPASSASGLLRYMHDLGVSDPIQSAIEAYQQAIATSKTD